MYRFEKTDTPLTSVTKRDTGRGHCHDCKMAIPYMPPLPTAEDWAAFDLEVQRRRGAACFGAAAAHFGTTSPKTLEVRIEQKRYVTQYDERTSSGKYMRWYRDGVRPSDATAARIKERSGGAVDIQYWRDLPLWELLDPTPPPIDRLHQLMEAMPRGIGRLLFGDSPEWRTPRFVHHILERNEYLAIRNIGSLDAFICLLCLACKGDLLDHDPSHYTPARCALDLFPRVVHRHPALAFQWEKLYACLSRIFWQRAYSNGVGYQFDIEVTRQNLLALQEGRPDDMKLYSGRRPPRDEEQQVITTSV